MTIFFFFLFPAVDGIFYWEILKEKICADFGGSTSWENLFYFFIFNVTGRKTVRIKQFNGDILRGGTTFFFFFPAPNLMYQAISL